MKVSACSSVGDYAVSVNVEFDTKEQADLEQAGKFISYIIGKNKDGDAIAR